MPSIFVLAKRNLKKFLTDPFSIIFAIVLPLIIFCIIKGILINNTAMIWRTGVFASGMCCFAYSLTSMFMAISFVEDKKTNFVVRLKIAPISNWTYLFSFILAMAPLLFGQTLIIFLFGFIFKLPVAPANFFLAIIYLIPSAFFFLTVGALLGIACKNSIQVACISVIIIALTIIFGGIALPLYDLPSFENICSYLPFYHCVQIAARLYSENNLGSIYPHILWILGYSTIFWGIIVLIKYMQNKK